MQIKIFKDVKKYALTSSLKKEDIELVKKYRPAALKEKDAEGNDVFAISYVEGKPSIAPIGMTFGSASNEGGYAMIVGDLPTVKAGEDYKNAIADIVGSALGHINTLEATIPTVVAEIKSARTALLSSIEEA